jgi:NitT/TauT family transport system substrate-binding protein
MVAAVRDGWQAYLDDADKTNEYMGKLNPTMDAQTFKESAEAQKPLIQSPETEKLGLGAMTLARWHELVQQLVELKVIDRPVAAESCFMEPSKAK